MDIRTWQSPMIWTTCTCMCSGGHSLCVSCLHINGTYTCIVRHSHISCFVKKKKQFTTWAKYKDLYFPSGSSNTYHTCFWICSCRWVSLWNQYLALWLFLYWILVKKTCETQWVALERYFDIGSRLQMDVESKMGQIRLIPSDLCFMLSICLWL